MHALQLHVLAMEPLGNIAIICIVAAIIFAVLGYGGIASQFAGIAKFLLILFVILFLLSWLLGWRF